jgi:hypothetical protein
MTWHKLVFEIGGKLVGGLAESIGHAFGKKTFGGIAHGGSNQDSAIAQSLSNNSEALRSLANAQSSLARVQQEQNKLKQAELMINAVLTREQLAQQADLARQERELKAQLSELWRNLQRELQQNDLQSREKLQTRQIQADWDKIKLPTIFSRQELEALAQDTEHPLFVCAKMQITEGCPNYFRTELTAEAESQIKKFANSVFRGDVRFYSRFFDDENIFDTNAAQLRSIIPDVPCVKSFSKVTRRSAFFHYHLWGSRSAEILGGNYDEALPWREVAEQLRDAIESSGASITDDDLYETIGDWLTTFQKIYAVFFVDLYALVDGDNPFYATKLDSVNVGLPEDIAGQYIQPLMEILQRVQNERIEAFNEELRRQQEEDERKYQEKLRKQQEVATREEEKRQHLPSFQSARGMEGEYEILNFLLAAQKWRRADELTREIMLKVVNRTSAGRLCENSVKAFPSEDLMTINGLWVHHSNGKFGFSVQKKIWLECGGKIGQKDYEVFNKFATKVGWFDLENNHWTAKGMFGWRTYDEFMNETQNAQNAFLASLPTTAVNKDEIDSDYSSFWGGCWGRCFVWENSLSIFWRSEL